MEVDQMEGRDVAPSLTNIHEKLLNHEAKLITNPNPVTFPITEPKPIQCQLQPESKPNTEASICSRTGHTHSKAIPW